jgi:small subunit ribosomal protein S1
MKNGDDFEALLAQFEQEHAGATEPASIGVGDRVQGKVVSIGEAQVFVDLGGKSEGIMEIAALTDADGNLTAGVGDTVEATVTSIDEETGSLLLGAQQARHLHGLAELEQAYRQQLPVDGRVTGAVKGGVEVQIAGQRAFCPASQVDIRFVEDLSEFVGQHLSFRITKLEGGRRPNLVVSRRALLEEEQLALAAETRARIEEGAVLAGTVTSVKDYGAFVDLGGVEGMVHVSELAYGHVKHPSDVLREGQPVEVQVLRIEQTDNPKRPEKIALSIRALARDPWQDASQRFPVGSRVKGTVTRLQPFGVFVEIEPGLEGLVHVSELGAGRRVSHPQEAVSSGQEVEATVLGVDPEKRRISLSLDASKQASDAPPAASYADYDKPDKSFGTLGDLLRESMQQQKKK